MPARICSTVKRFICIQFRVFFRLRKLLLCCTIVYQTLLVWSICRGGLPLYTQLGFCTPNCIKRFDNPTPYKLTSTGQHWLLLIKLFSVYSVPLSAPHTSSSGNPLSLLSFISILTIWSNLQIFYAFLQTRRHLWNYISFLKMALHPQITHPWDIFWFPYGVNSN